MKKTLFLIATTFLLLANPVYAAPYFYLGNLQTVYTNKHELKLYLYSDQTLTAAHTVVSFDSSILSPLSITTPDFCFPSPADPSLSLGTQSSPYFYNGVKFIVSCGFYYPGYTSSDSDGDLIATIKFDTIATGSSSLTFDSGSTKFYYNGTFISAGTMTNTALIVSPYIEATPAPGATPPSYASYSATLDDLNFVEIGVNSSSTTTTTSTSTSSDADLSVVEQDDTIPPPGTLPDRPRPTPLLLKLLGSNKPETDDQQDEGEVLASQSLRELLIPGKSSADKTVVLINLISALTFLLILAILIWKFISIKRSNKVKSQHMSELLMGELAVLETKLGSKDGDDQESKDISETIKKISDELKDTN